MTLSFTQEADFRKEREFGQKISATFEFIQAHWRPLGRVLLYTVLPAALLQGVLSSTLQVTLWNKVLTNPSGNEGARGLQQMALMSEKMGSPVFWLSTLVSVAFFALVMLSVYGYLLLCLRREPGAAADIRPADVWTVIRREFVGTCFAIVGLYLLTLLATLLFVLPGIYLGVVLSLFFIVRLVEGTGFRATLSRCRYLMQGKWWSTFGLIMVMSLLLYALLLVPGLLAGVLGGGLAVLAQDGLFKSQIFLVVFSALGTLLTLFFYPPLLLVLAFQYFNLVERRDGTGLRSLIGQLGQPAPAAPRNASLRADEEGEY